MSEFLTSKQCWLILLLIHNTFRDPFCIHSPVSFSQIKMDDAMLSLNNDFRERSASNVSKKSVGEINEVCRDGNDDEAPSEWNKCIELLDKKKETDEKISQQVILVANLGKAFDETVQQDEGEQQQHEEQDENATDSTTRGGSETELGATETSGKYLFGSQQQRQQNNATRSRRSKRLYSPSPPPSLSGELGRKKRKEKFGEEIAATSISSQPLPSAAAAVAPSSSLLKWAKVPPSSSSLSSSLDSNGISAVIHDSQTHTKKNLPKEKLSAEIASVQAENVQNAKGNGDDPSNIQLIRQNEKLTRENVQLKQRNQEQQQQIQALIGANRELIWAFNESRREHDELMQQLRVMAKLVNNSSNSTRSADLNNSCGTLKYQPNAKNARPKQIGQKKVAAAEGVSGIGKRQRKKQCTGMVYVAEEQLPPSLAILKKPTLAHEPTSATPSDESVDQQQQTAFEQSSMPNEQLRERVKKELIQSVERRHNVASLVNRDEEIDKIKHSLSKMTPDPNLNKLIGSRKPVFYTPSEYGDWHSVISSMSRKHNVLQLFEALCPEFHGSNVVEMAVLNPSRADFIQKSLNFVFDAENELFVSSNARDSYFSGIAEKIYTLREAKERQNVDKHRHNGSTERIGETVRRRTLADVLKPKVKPSAADDVGILGGAAETDDI